jgi:hypothetical protein
MPTCRHAHAAAAGRCRSRNEPRATRSGSSSRAGPATRRCHSGRNERAPRSIQRAQARMELERSSTEAREPGKAIPHGPSIRVRTGWSLLACATAIALHSRGCEGRRCVPGSFASPSSASGPRPALDTVLSRLRCLQAFDGAVGLAYADNLPSGRWFRLRHRRLRVCSRRRRSTVSLRRRNLASPDEPERQAVSSSSSSSACWLMTSSASSLKASSVASSSSSVSFRRSAESSRPSSSAHASRVP